MVKASEAVPRDAANSVCTTGSATTTAHMPHLPSEPIRTATAKRVHARRESGTNNVESGLRGEAMSTAAATSLASASRSIAMARYLACRCGAHGHHPSFRADAKQRTADVQLHIGESRS